MNSGSATSELEVHFDFVRGCASEAIRDERRAIRYYRREIRKTQYFKAHFNLARLLAKRTRLKEAIGHYKEAVRRSRTRIERSDALNNLGLLYSRRGLTVRAHAVFQQACQANSRNAAPYVNAALGLFRRSEITQGRRWLERAHRLRRLDGHTNRWIGYALVKYDLDVRKGVRMLEGALKHNPKDACAMADLALGYTKLGVYAKARIIARRATRLASAARKRNRQLGLVV